MSKNITKRMLAFLLALAMVLTGSITSITAANYAKAAKKVTLKLSNTRLSLQPKQSSTLKITKKNVKKIKKQAWKTSNKAVATVSKKGKVTAIKAGTAKISCKVTYIAKGSSKKKTKTISATVTVATPATKAPTKKPTQKPSTTQGPKPTATPVVVWTPHPTRKPSGAIPAANIVKTGKVEDTNVGEAHLSRYGIETKDNGIMRTNLSTQDIVDSMGLGWNIGNSLEQVDAHSVEKLTPEEQRALSDEAWVKGFETNASNVQSTQKMMDGLKAYGINTIRIPIAWSNMMAVGTNKDGSKFYQINEAYFDRVETVMNYCLNNEMYVIINIHWDNGWWGMFGDRDPAIQKEGLQRYKDFWTQISERYAEYSDRVIFEGANEELGERLNDAWRGGESQFSFEASKPGQGGYGILTKSECYAKVKELNQLFVDIVRNSGGNNKYRYLLIPGFNTNIHDTCTGDESGHFEMPKDIDENTVNRLFVSIHYYDPIGWGIAKSASQGYAGYADTWGSEEDYAYMAADFKEAKEAFIDKGYTVIFGEFGVLSTNKTGVDLYFKEFFEKCKENGMLPVMWDEGGYVDRLAKDNGRVAFFLYEDIGNIFSEITGQKPTLRPDAIKLLTKTGKQGGIAENQNPLVIATWEGNFMRSTNGSKSANTDYIRETFGDDFLHVNSTDDSGNVTSWLGGYFGTDKITINPNYPDLSLKATYAEGYWHMHLLLNDWSQIKDPCVRITMHDDEPSQSADLQLVYGDDDSLGDAMAWRYEADYEQIAGLVDGTDWQGNAMKVPMKNADGTLKLSDEPWIGRTVILTKENLEKFPLLILTTNNYLGADFQKVEICDGAYNADGTEYVPTNTEGK